MENLSKFVRITVTTSYLESQSDPDAHRFVFAYAIEIQNTGTEPFKLISRYWHIKDENEKVQEVTGDGVVGQKPVIAPGKAFQYTSAAIINTEIGTMRGSYIMESPTGKQFNTPIAPFLLSTPHTTH